MTRAAGVPSRQQVKASIRYSTAEGVASSTSEGATEQYYVPYALAAGASPASVGWLVTAAQLVSAFCYLKIPQIVRALGGRKRAILVLVLLDATTFLPFMILPFFLHDHLVQSVFIFYALSAVPGITVVPIWASWITDLVPAGVRGRYLGLRSTLMGCSGLVAFVAAGFVLDSFEAGSFAGFAFIFGFATLTRLVSWLMYWRMHDVPLAAAEDAGRLGVADIREAVGHGSVGRFMVFSALFYFAVFLASPYFAVYMLSELEFSYVTFMFLICSEQIARLAILHFWGRYADKRGSMKVVRIACCFVPAVPVLWLVSHEVYFLAFVQLLSGCLWAGFELCGPNFIYGASPSGSRIKYIALYRSLNGAAMAVGALVGGYLAIYLPPLLGSSILSLFLISGLLRGIVALRMLPSIVDVTHKRGMGLAHRFVMRKGLLAGDAVSDGFGWGLLYIPAAVRRQLTRAMGSRRSEVAESRTGGHRGLFYNKAWQLLLQRFGRRESAATVATNSELRREGMRHRADVTYRQIGAAEAGKASGGTVSESVGGLSFARPPSRSAQMDAGAGLVGQQREAVQAPREPDGLLHTRTVRLPTPGPARTLRVVANEPRGVRLPERQGLFYSGAWEAVRQRFAGAKSVLSAAASEVRRYGEGLLHNAGAWRAYLQRTGAGARRTSEPAASVPVRQGMFRNMEAWRRFVRAVSGAANPSGALARSGSSREGLLHQTHAWVQYMKRTVSTAVADPSGALVAAGSAREGLLHQSHAWSECLRHTGPAEVADPSGKLDVHVAREGFLHNAEAWRLASQTAHALDGDTLAWAEDHDALGKLEHKPRKSGLLRTSQVDSFRGDHAATEQAGRKDPDHPAGLLHFRPRRLAYLES